MRVIESHRVTEGGMPFRGRSLHVAASPPEFNTLVLARTRCKSVPSADRSVLMIHTGYIMYFCDFQVRTLSDAASFQVHLGVVLQLVSSELLLEHY